MGKREFAITRANSRSLGWLYSLRTCRSEECQENRFSSGLSFRRTGAWRRVVGSEAVAVQLLMRDEEAADVAEGFFVGRHLAEVIPPGVRLEGAAGVRLAGNGDHLAAGIQAGEPVGRHDELDLLALFPEVFGEVVGKKQGVVTMAGGQKFDGGGGSRPVTGDFGLKPGAKVESVCSSLEDEQA